MRKALVILFVAGGLVCAGRASAVGTTYYVDCNSASDGGLGTSVETAWKTASKLKTAKLNPGDSVLFKRGCVWREKLSIKASGQDGSLIAYGAYGTGNKPSFRGSDLFNSESLWTRESGNLWFVSSLNGNPYVFIHDDVAGKSKLNKNELTSQWDIGLMLGIIGCMCIQLLIRLDWLKIWK